MKLNVEFKVLLVLQTWFEMTLVDGIVIEFTHELFELLVTFLSHLLVELVLCSWQFINFRFEFSWLLNGLLLNLLPIVLDFSVLMIWFRFHHWAFLLLSFPVSLKDWLERVVDSIDSQGKHKVPHDKVACKGKRQSCNKIEVSEHRAKESISKIYPHYIWKHQVPTWPHLHLINEFLLSLLDWQGTLWEGLKEIRLREDILNSSCFNHYVKRRVDELVPGEIWVLKLRSQVFPWWHISFVCSSFFSWLLIWIFEVIKLRSMLGLQVILNLVFDSLVGSLTLVSLVHN